MTTTDRLIELLRERHEAGLKNYGVTVDRTDLTPEQWAQHAIEEMLDGAAYLMRLKDDITVLRERIKRLEQAGDKMYWSFMHPFDTAHESVPDAWQQAKEDKP